MGVVDGGVGVLYGALRRVSCPCSATCCNIDVYSFGSAGFMPSCMRCGDSVICSYLCGEKRVVEERYGDIVRRCVWGCVMIGCVRLLATIAIS